MNSIHRKLFFAACTLHFVPTFSVRAAGAATTGLTTGAAFKMAEHTQLLPTIFISHGGGPCFFFEGGMFTEMDKNSKAAGFLRNLRAQTGDLPIKNILIISGHYEGDTVSVMTAPKHKLFFDYYGFPEEAYKLTWPAPGAPDLAARVRSLLGEAGIPTVEDPKRGLDHGVFVPLKLAFPDADIPITQLSMHSSYSPELHIRMGKALAPLRAEGTLIIGSGAITHNLGAVRTSRPYGPVASWAKEFDEWVKTTLTEVSSEERERRLLALKTAPHFREAHPREDHFIPLLVAVGAATGNASTGSAAAAAVAADGTSASAAAGETTKVAGKGKQIYSQMALGTFSLASYRFD